MIDTLAKSVDPVIALNVIVILILIAVIIYKSWPEFKRRVSSGPLKQQKDEINDETVDTRLDSIETEVRQINEKLSRDYGRLNHIEVRLDKAHESQADQMEELELIIQALLGILKGLQEQGLNGPTKEAEDKIQAYLTKKAHKHGLYED